MNKMSILSASVGCPHFKDGELGLTWCKGKVWKIKVIILTFPTFQTCGRQPNTFGPRPIWVADRFTWPSIYISLPLTSPHWYPVIMLDNMNLPVGHTGNAKTFPLTWEAYMPTRPPSSHPYLCACPQNRPHFLVVWHDFLSCSPTCLAPRPTSWWLISRLM